MDKALQEKVDVAIQRIKTFEPKDGYFVAYSGGKDSTVLLELVRRAGVKHDVHYSVTTVDPPELVRFIISQFDTVVYAYHDGRQKRFRNVGGATKGRRNGRWERSHLRFARAADGKADTKERDAAHPDHALLLRGP